MRRSTVLTLPLQLVFPALQITRQSRSRFEYIETMVNVYHDLYA
jgi:hypothetical protein